MRAVTAIAAAVLAAAVLSGSALAKPKADPLLPFPSAKAGPVFIASHVTTPDGTIASWFKPGDQVVFRAYAIDTKTKKYLAQKNVRYFYVTIPGQPNVKLTYSAAPSVMKNMPWTGTWTVPSTLTGQVSFRILIKTTARRTGEFVQMPIATSQLNIATNAMPVLGPAPTGTATTASGAARLGLYVDSVNGTRPTGAAPRLVGCSQTNVFKRGEQFVLRVWGMDLKGGAVLSNDNVDSAKYSIAGQPDVTLNWGAHGTAPARVWFWSGAWNIPATFPLGTTTLTVSFKMLDGATATYSYDVNIIP